MTALEIFTYRDRGAGFERQAGGHDAVAAEPYWQAIEWLRENLLFQAPGSLDTTRHPAWSLHRAQVQGTAYWCFALQAGKNAALGAAGGSQFVFLDGRLRPVDVWRQCVAHVRDGRLATEPDASVGGAAAPAAEGPARECVEGVLAGLAEGRPRIALRAEPSRAAALVTTLLAVLPARIVGGYMWSTCLLERPVDAEQRVVGGRWPEDFRRQEPDAARPLDQWFATGDHAGGPELAGRDRDALDWLVGAALELPPSGHAPTAEADVGTLRELLGLIARHHLSLIPADVPQLLADRAGQDRLAAQPDELGFEWAAAEPAAARHRMRHEPALLGPLERQLVRGLMQATSATGRDQLNMPGGEWADPRWEQELTRVLTTQFERQALIDWLVGVNAATLGVAPSGGPDRRRFLYGVGAVRTRAPQLYPFDLGRVLAALGAGHGLDHAAREELRVSADPAGDVRQVLGALDDRAVRMLRPNDAAELVHTATRAGEHHVAAADIAVDHTERLVRARCRVQPGSAGEWTLELVVALGAHTAVAVVAQSAVVALDQSDVDVPDELLVRTLGAMQRSGQRPGPEQHVLQLLRRRIEEPPRWRWRWRWPTRPGWRRAGGEAARTRDRTPAIAERSPTGMHDHAVTEHPVLPTGDRAAAVAQRETDHRGWARAVGWLMAVLVVVVLLGFAVVWVVL